MSYGILKNGQASERANGLRFIETFENASEVAKNGGTIVGTPVINNGATLDGINDNFVYSGQEQLFNSANISMIIEFYPDFPASADGTARYFCDSTGNRNYIVRSGLSGNLQIALNATAVANISPSSYSAYWKQGARNVLTISTTSGATNIWLNGNSILSGGTISWTPDDLTTFFIGSSNASDNRFDGKMTSFRVFKSLLTTQDAINYYNNSTFNYEDKASVNLPMGMAQHDPSYIDTTNLLVDGDMEASGTSAWASYNSAVLSKQTTNPQSGTQCLRVAYGGSSTGYAQQGVLTIGKKYRITGYARGNGVVAPRIYAGGVGGYSIIVFSTSTDWQYFDVILTAANTDLRCYCWMGSVDDYSEFDNISITEYKPRTLDVSGKGNHAYLGEGTVSAMPTKLTERHGYDLQGGDYIRGVLSQNLPDKFTITFSGNIPNVSSSNRVFNFYDEHRKYFMFLRTTTSVYIGQNNKYKIINGIFDKLSSFFIASFVYTRSLDKVDFYLNGDLIDTFVGGTLDPIGSETENSFYCNMSSTGETIANNFMIIPLELSLIQVSDLHNNLMKKFNRK